MAHHIADACLFLHVRAGCISGNVENYLSGRMDSCPGVSIYSSAEAGYNVFEQYEFFLTTVSPLFVFPLEPDICTQVVAYDTCFDSSPGYPDGTYNAVWLDEKYSEVSAAVKGNAISRDVWMSWFQADEGSDQHKAYLVFKRIEEIAYQNSL